MSTAIDVASNPYFHYDLDKMCAVCNKKLYADKVPINRPIPGAQLHVTLLEELQTITGSSFQDAPMNVCTKCYQNTVAVFRFRRLCNNSCENLRIFLSYQEAMKRKKFKKKPLVQQEEQKAPTVLDMKKESTEEIVVKYEQVELEEIAWANEGGVSSITNLTEMTEAEEEIIIQIPNISKNVEDNLSESNSDEIVVEVSPQNVIEENNANNTVTDEENDMEKDDDDDSEIEEGILETNQKDESERGNDIPNAPIKRSQCKVCHKTVRSDYLNVHMRLHTGHKPYKCSFEDCSRSFRTSTTMKLHEKCHSEARNFICRFCGNRFKLLATLKIHERTHTGERPFPCGLCDLSFPSSSRRKQHQLVHTGTRDFQCELCAKSFTRLTVLKDHLKSHAGIKNFVCRMCGKRFTQRHTLVSHEADRCKVQKELIASAEVPSPIEVLIIEQIVNE